MAFDRPPGPSLTGGYKRPSLPFEVWFPFYRRKSLGTGLWAGLSKSGVSFGRPRRYGSASVGRREVGGSVRLDKGLP